MNYPSKAFVILFVTVLLDGIGLRIIYPVSASILTEIGHFDVHESVLYNGWLLAIYAFMQFLFAPFLGSLSDRYGRRPILLFSLLGMSISYLLMSVANTLPLLFFARMLAGFSGSSLTTAFAYTADISNKDDRPKLFGYLGAAISFGFIIGPFIGGYFSQWGLRVPFLVAAFISLINALLGFFLLPESNFQRTNTIRLRRINPLISIYNYFRNKTFSSFLLVLLFLFISGQILPVIWPFYTKLVLNWSDAKIGYSLAFVGLTMAFVRLLLIGRLTKRWGALVTVLFGISFTFIGFLVFGFSHSQWTIFLGVVIFALGSVASPTLQAVISSKSNVSNQGEIQGVISSLLSLVNMVAPLIVAQVFYLSTQQGHYQFPGLSFLIGGFFSFVGFFVVLKLIQTNSK